MTFDDKNVKMRERQQFLYHLCSCMKIGTEEKRMGLEIASHATLTRKIKKKTKSLTNQLFPCNIYINTKDNRLHSSASSDLPVLKEIELS